MEIPIEISFDSEKPKRRGPPPRFAAMMAQKEKQEAKETKDLPKPTVESTAVNQECQIRFVHNPICKDNPNPCSLEEAITTLTNFYPQFNTAKETIDTNPKWQEKVQSMNNITQFIRDNAKSQFQLSEPSIIYALSFSKEFKAANMNICKCSLDCIKGVTETCGIGPRVADRVISSLIPKIHDRKLGSDVSDLILLIGEYAGPNVIISAISKGMSQSKVPLQQKAALVILSRVVNEFGSYSIDVKSLFSYLQSEQAILNTHVEVKNQTIAVFCSLHRQIGEVILQLLESSGLKEVLLKSIKESFESAPFDPSLASKYAAQVPADVHETAPPKPQFSMDDLVTAADLSTALPPLLKLLNTTEGKESWKQRQQGLIEIEALLKQKHRVINNRVVSELVTSLKNRLSESHLMLKAKVLQCVAVLADAIGDEIIQYNPSLLSEMMKLTSESNKTVIDSLYEALSHWVNHSEKSVKQMFVSVCSYLSGAFKSIKGRLPFLRWLNQFIHHGDKRGLLGLLPGCIDCVLDKTKEVRNEAVAAVKTIGTVCGRLAVEDDIKKRRNSDQLTLKSSLKAVLENLPSVATAVTPEPTHLPVEKTDKEEKSRLTEARIQALANRPGARVLSKRTTSISDSLKRQAVSSIPKPQPPLKKRVKEPEMVLEIKTDQEPEPEPEPRHEEVLNSIEENPSQPLERDLFTEPPLPSPSMSCLSLHPLLVEARDSLLSQKELAQCCAGSTHFQPRQLLFIPSVLSSFSRLQMVLAQNTVMVLFEQANQEYNQFIESSTQLCWVLNRNIQVQNSEAFVAFTQTISNTAVEEIEMFLDALLRLLSTLLSQLISSMNHGMQIDALLLIHVVNSMASLLRVSSHCTVTPSTLSVFLTTLIQGIFEFSQDMTINENQSLKSVFHKLLRLSIDLFPLPTLLEGTCLCVCEMNASIKQTSEEEMTVVLIKRYFSSLLTRINSTQMDDCVKMNCVEKMKAMIPADLHPSLRCEIDRCIHVLEPVHVTSTSFGEVLKSANQMLTSQSVSSNLTTATMLKNQMESFKQRYMANRQNENSSKKEESSEPVELPIMTDKELEQEERMKKIREMISQRRSS